MNTSPAQGGAPTIDVVSDVICPWCYIGGRQLETALSSWAAQHPGQPAPAVAWHPFQLNPSMPAQGMDRSEYLRAKFGDADPARFDRVRQAAAAVGLPLHLERIRTVPNTLRAHALIAAARHDGQQHALAGALFRAYFVEGRDLGDESVLRALALGEGLDGAQIEAAFAPQALEAAAEADLSAREMGIGGVPFFIVGRRIAVSGAQGAEALLEAMRQASD